MLPLAPHSWIPTQVLDILGLCPCIVTIRSLLDELVTEDPNVIHHDGLKTG